MNFKSVKTQVILFLLCFAVFLAVKDRDVWFLAAAGIAVVAAAGAESVILYAATKTFQITESSIITGLIAGFVVSSDEPWWRLALAAMAAILAKHIIRFKKRHIFNPAALGIFLAIILLHVSTQWKGTYAWYILVPFGLYFARTISKLEIIAGYAAVFLLLFGSQAVMQKVPLLHVFGYVSYFYLFIMVIEPKTTPMRPRGKLIFGAAAAGLIFLLTEIGVRFDAELFSLLVVNAAVPLLNKIPQGKKGGIL
jgi:Na+-translocating ferredoxin:NAD+ oxidoreductase RnfD subunit